MLMHISVPLVGITEEKLALCAAMQLAADLGANLFSSFLRPAYTFATMEKRLAHMERYDYYGYAHAVADFKQAFLRIESESEEAVKSSFAENIASIQEENPHLHDIKAEWQDDHTLVDSQDAYFQRLAMLSDILVVCGAIRNDPYYEHSLAHFLLSSARPVLVVPPTAKITPLEESDIVLGWEPSASTIRAITMTMPFLRRARKVYLLPFGDLQGPVCSQDIQLFLSNHNVNVDLLAPLSSEGLAETVFLHTAETVKPAMIILGGHIHSRLRDLVLGSSTEYMLNNCRAPLCLVH